MTTREKINSITNVGLEIYMQHDLRQFRCSFCHGQLLEARHATWFNYPNSHFAIEDNVIAYNCNKRGKFGTIKLKQ